MNGATPTSVVPSDASPTSLLSVRGLSVGHGVCALFPNLDADLFEGELVCLLGRNGAGKTTLLKTLAGILPPLAGTVSLGDDRLDELPVRERAQRVALLLTDPALPPFLLGRELVALGRTPHAPWLSSGLFSTSRESEADEGVVTCVMETMRCAHLANRRLGTLSDGERQRLCLARALAQDTQVLLLDEPLSHLDPPAKAELLLLLHEWARAGSSPEDGGARGGRVVVAAVHEVDLALGFADRCLLVATGVPPFLGAPEAAAGEPLTRIFPGWPSFWDPLGLRKRRNAL